MTTPFQQVLQSHYPGIYYGYETIQDKITTKKEYDEDLQKYVVVEHIITREEYEEVFQRCVVEHRELLVDMLRQQRNKVLAETDYCMLPDYPITDERKAEVIAYRQRLRDITEGELPRFSRCDYVLEFDLSG